MITLIHRVGPKACGGVAFWYDEEGAPENMIDASRVELTSGLRPNEGDTMTCCGCGKAISPIELDALPGKFEEEA